MSVIDHAAVAFESSVSCIYALRNFVVFTSSQHLYVWPTDASEPLPGKELPFTPAVMCGYENQVFAACSSAAAVLTLCGLPQTFIIQKIFFPPSNAIFFPLIAHATYSCDGSMVAISSQSDVFVVCAADIDEIPDEEDEDTGELISNSNSFLTVSCQKWFGTSDAVITVFDASKLYVVSKNNHLISFHILGSSEHFDEGEDGEGEEEKFCFARDGQIVAASSSVVSLATDSKNGAVLVGLSSGVVIVLSAETLVPQYTIQLRSTLMSCIKDNDGSPLNLTNVELVPLDIKLTSLSHFTVVTPVALMSFSRASYTLAAEDSVSLLSEVIGVGSISSSGQVILWSPFQCHCQKFTWLAQRMAAGQPATDLVDIIHASQSIKCLNEVASSPLVVSQPADTSKLKPVTFGMPIKSSGYSASLPWSVQQANKAKAKAIAAQKKKAPSTAAFVHHQYDVNSPPPCVPLQKSNDILGKTKLHTAVISSTAFDAQGTALYTASGDSTIHALKFPVAKFGGDGVAVRGHTSMVNSLDVALAVQHPLVASGSLDGTVALWRPTKREAPYIFTNTGKEVKSVRFMYMDKLLCYSSGGSIHFASYLIDEGGGDLDRKRNQSKLHVVHTLATAAQMITSMSCVNSFLSSIVVWSGSNRQLSVFDIAAEKDVCSVEDAHSRPIHTVALMSSSRYAELSADALHLFASASTDKTVRLWDMRQSRPVRQFSSHSNSSMKVGLALSPCGKFVAVGSEDRAVYFYSIADGVLLSKLSTPETVTSIAFHPLDRGVVAVGCANGDARLFGVK